MEEIFIGILFQFTKVLGLCYRVLIRAPYTHQKSHFSKLRCISIYIRLFLILYSFEPNLISANVPVRFLELIKIFFFPYYSALTEFPQEYQVDFWTILIIHILTISVFILAKTFWFGEMKLKGAFYIMELILPDMFLFLVHNHLELSPFIYFSKT